MAPWDEPPEPGAAGAGLGYALGMNRFFTAISAGLDLVCTVCTVLMGVGLGSMLGQWLNLAGWDIPPVAMVAVGGFSGLMLAEVRDLLKEIRDQGKA